MTGGHPVTVAPLVNLVGTFGISVLQTRLAFFHSMKKESAASSRSTL